MFYWHVRFLPYLFARGYRHIFDFPTIICSGDTQLFRGGYRHIIREATHSHIFCLPWVSKKARAPFTKGTVVNNSSVGLRPRKAWKCPQSLTVLFHFLPLLHVAWKYSHSITIFRIPPSLTLSRLSSRASAKDCHGVPPWPTLSKFLLGFPSRFPIAPLVPPANMPVKVWNPVWKPMFGTSRTSRFNERTLGLDSGFRFNFWVWSHPLDSNIWNAL